ncbi:MAG: hypothetical protein VZR11_13340 [Succinimonas sp.]|nr:hypothetical protein [Succinimonas sp.]
MKSEKPGSARLVYCIYVALIIFICMGTYHFMNVMQMQDKAEGLEYEERQKYLKEFGDYYDAFMTLEHGDFQVSAYFTEKICENGKAVFCLVRGLLALDPGDPKSTPEQDRPIAEEYFKKACAGDAFPVCRLIAETRKDSGAREPRDEERVITGIWMTGCDGRVGRACGHAAMRLFEAGDYKRARSYGTEGCVKKDHKANPFNDPRSCEYRKLALEKLAQETSAPGDTALPEEPSVSHVPHSDTAPDKQ